MESYTPTQVAVMWHFSTAFITKLCRLGKIKAERDDRNRWRITDESVAACMRPSVTPATATKSYYFKYPERSRAHAAVAKAIRRGELVRQPCEDCGDPETHGHHPDYSKPLEVQWKCSKCHALVHRKKRAPQQ